jgi:hypothetical protein
MINPFKKKCESLVSLDENVKILDKPELDAIFYLISKFKSIGDEDKYKADELITPQATACMIAFSEMFPANALNVTYCFHRSKNDVGPVCLKVIDKTNKYMFLQSPWDNENPYIQILELMPYIIYTCVYFLYDSAPGEYPCFVNNNTAAMINLCAYYSACVEYILAEITESKFINHDLLRMLTDYDKEYLTQYCNIYVLSFKPNKDKKENPA